MIKKITLADNFADERFLLSRTIAYIAENLPEKSTPVDLGEYLFVLPSAEAGRLFREKAAIFFQQYGGVTRLTSILPEQLLFSSADINYSDIQSLDSWFHILKNADPDDFISGIFPDVSYKTETLISLAESFTGIRETILLESGLDSEEFIQLGVKNTNLKLKLDDYIKLEKIYLDKLGQHIDKAQAIKNSLNSPFDRFPSVKKIILVENSELRGGIKIMLDKLSEKIEVIHLLNTTAENIDDFDAYGCPVTEKMMKIDLPIDLEKQLRIFSNPIREAEKIASFLEKDNLPSSVGIMDNELALTLTHLLEEKNIESYTPSVRPLKSFYWSKLFLALADLNKKNIPFEDVYKLAADAAFVKLFNISSGVRLREQIEKLQRDHMIQDFDSLKFFAELYFNNENLKKNYTETYDFCCALSGLSEKIRQISPDSMPEGLWDIFTQTAVCAPLDSIDMKVEEISLEALKNAVISVRNITDNDIRMTIFKHKLAKTSVSGAQGYKDEALNLSGFLDLIWYENPSLILGGISEDAFSSAAVEDKFFPEHIRKMLNWSSAYSRFGADIHRFEQLLKQYSSEEFFITFASASKSGELRTAPRLFFNVSNEKLLKNCRLIFKEDLVEKTPAAEKNNNILTYSSHITDKLSSNISVTAFKKYIECPYTFYLSEIMKCKDPGKELFEIQPNQTGTILHGVFEKYGIAFGKNIPSAKDINDFCLKELARQFYNCAGFAPNNLLLMQNEEISKNITAFAEYEFAERTSVTDHKIIHTEKNIDISLRELIQRLPQEYINHIPALAPECEEIRIKGKLDRIDSFTQADGTLICRIIDYKSANSATAPAKDHLTGSVPDHLEPEMMTAGTDARGNTLYFSNMQLIIYSLFANFMRNELDIDENAEIQCGYYNIPLNVNDTSIEIFSELDNAMLKKGAASLIYLVNRIFAERRFWPPSLTAKYGVALKYLETNDLNDFAKENK